MDVKSLKKIRTLVGKLDKYCKYSEVAEYTYEADGTFVSSEYKQLDTLDEEQHERYLAYIKDAFRGNLSEKGKLHEYSMFDRVRPTDECNINKLKAVHEKAVNNGLLLDKDAVDAYVNAIAPHIAVNDTTRSYIPAKRGVKRYTIHTMALHVALPVSKKALEACKPREIEPGVYAEAPTRHRCWLERWTCVLTWVTTVKQVKTRMVQDGKIVEYTGEALPERPILTVTYPVAKDYDAPIADPDRVLFGSGMKFDVLAPLVRNAFDCDVHTSVEQCAERFDTYVEEAVGGVMPLDLKVKLLGSIEEHAETCVGGVPDFTLAPNFLDLELENLGVIHPNNDDPYEIHRSETADAIMCDRQVYPGAAFLERKHEIVIKDAGVRIQFDGTVPMYKLIRVVDDVDKCSCLQMRLVGDNITLDGTPVMGVPLQKLLDIAEFPEEPQNLRSEDEPYVVDDYTRDYYEEQKKKEYNPLLEFDYRDTDENGEYVPTAYMKRLYNKYKTTHEPYHTFDYEGYEEIIDARATVRKAMLQRFVAECKEESTVRHFIKMPNGTLQRRNNWKTDKDHIRQKSKEFNRMRDAAIAEQKEQDRIFHENMEQYGFCKVVTNGGEVVMQAGDAKRSREVTEAWLRKQEEAIENAERKKQEEKARHAREIEATYQASVEHRGRLVRDCRTGELMNTALLPEGWTYKDDQYLMTQEEYDEYAEKVKNEKERKRVLAGRKKTAELTKYRLNGELPPAADPEEILPF